MQNLKLYTGYFKTPTKSGGLEFKRFSESFVKFNEFYQGHIPTYQYAYLKDAYNKRKLHGTLYNNILINISEYFGVKVMFIDILDQYQKPIRGIQIIGDELRIQIANHVLDILMDLVKKAKVLPSNTGGIVNKQDTKKAASLLVNAELKNITNLIKSLLVTDFKYTQRLENFILSHFKLDFKKYQTSTEPPYYHALTTRYYNGRMLL